MQISKKIRFDGIGECSGTIDEPTVCPLCHRAIKPQELAANTFKNNTSCWFISVSYLCKGCYQTFLTLNSCGIIHGGAKTYHASLKYIGPQRYEPKKFDDQIAELSPGFVKIYNQALAAENASLDEIAGLGYRKAMEFLIKDFCIRKNPDKEEEIKSAYLAQCIQKYVASSQIQTLATKAAWIGNDEAHYTRKHSDRDMQDMKQFIKATVYFIGMSLIADDAESMLPA